MSEKEYTKEFAPWYESMKDVKGWNFKAEMIKYCQAAVDVLAKAVLKLRHLIKQKLDTDPFRYITRPGMCMGIFKGMFMPDKTATSNTGLSRTASPAGNG